MTMRFFMAFLDHPEPWNFLLMVIQWNFSFYHFPSALLLFFCKNASLVLFGHPFCLLFSYRRTNWIPGKECWCCLVIIVWCETCKSSHIFNFCKTQTEFVCFSNEVLTEEPIAKQMWREYLNCWVTVLPVWAHKSRIGPTHKFGKYTKHAFFLGKRRPNRKGEVGPRGIR